MKFRLLIVFLLVLFLTSTTHPQSVRRTARPASDKDGLRFQTILVRKKGIRFPRLTYYPDAAVMKEVNRQIDEFTEEVGCDEGRPKKKENLEVRTQVEYASKQIFSIYVSESFFCGLYPTNDLNVSLTFNLKTGKQVEFEELFENYKENKAAILRVIFAKQIARSERLIAEGKVKEETCDGDFNLYSLKSLQDDSFAFNFSAQGLRVQPEWPHAFEACSKRVTVPYDKLKKFAAPDGLLARVLQQ